MRRGLTATRWFGADTLDDAVWYLNNPGGGAAIKCVTRTVFRWYGVTITKAWK
jgi:hypothetical protein